MDFVGFFDGSGCTFSNKPEALDSNECAQQSQKSSQRWCERGREKKKEREGCGLMEFSNQMTEKQKQPFL